MKLLKRELMMMPVTKKREVKYETSILEKNLTTQAKPSR